MKVYEWMNRETLLSALTAADNGYRHFGLMFGGRPDLARNLARTLPGPALESLGLPRSLYSPTDEQRAVLLAWLDSLPAKLVPVRTDVPMAGDAVVNRAGSCNIAPGAVGIVGGLVGLPMDDGACVTWNHSTFRGHSFRYADTRDGAGSVSCSGGPGHFVDPSRLKPTGETHTYRAWQWFDSARASGGMYFDVTVPLWEYEVRPGGWGYVAPVAVCDGKNESPNGGRS
jgi:hypothetical protein